MTADIATLGIRIDARQVRDADNALDHLSTTGRNTERSVDSLNAAMERMRRLALQVGAALSAVEIIKQADAWANLQGRLSLVADTQERLAQTNEALFSMAQRTRQGLVATADLYGKISRSTQDLNKTDAERLRLTETINKTLIISGTSQEQAAGALLQLGQAFGSGALRGDEFNSVLEGMPRLAEAIAAGMGKTTGELRALAAAGKLTSEVMFSSLANQAAKVDAEFAKLPTTIGQATTQMQNALLRTIGVFDQQNQLSAGLASSLTALAEHMGTLVTAAGTLAAVGLVKWLQSATVGLYEKIAATQASLVADRAAAAAALALAEANTVAAAAALRVAEVDAAAALGATARAASASRLTAALEAEAIAQNTLSAAQGRAAGVATAGSLAMSAIGGPLGWITLVLGLGATAWATWGDSADDANKKAAGAVAKSTQQIVDDLEKQNNKLLERIELSKRAGMSATAKSGGESADRLASMLQGILALQNSINAGTAPKNASLRLIEMQYEYTALANAIEKVAGNQAKLQAGTNTEKFAAWAQKHTEYLNKAGKIAAEIADARKELGDAAFDANKGAITKMITDSVNKQDVDKAKNSYMDLIASIHEKTAANQIEIAVGRNATEAQKEQIKLDQQIAAGKLKLTATQRAGVQTALDALAVSEKQAKAVQVQKDLTKASDEAALAQQEAAAGLAVYAANYGKLSDARDIDMIAVKNQFELQRKLLDAYDQGITYTQEQTDKMRADTAARTANEQAILAQTKALQYAEQLRQANQQFTVDYTLDPKAKAAAQLAIDKAMWTSRIDLAEQGTEARQRLETEYAQWLQNQSIKPQLDAQIAMWDSIEQAARDAFVGMLSNGKSTFERLRDSLKNTLFAFLYEMTLKKWIVQVEAQVIGSTAADSGVNLGGASGGGGMSGLIGKVQQARSLYNAVSGGLMDSAGSVVASAGNAISSIGSFFGATGSAGSSMSAFGAGMAGNSAGTTMTASEMFSSMGMTGEASAAGYGAMAGSALGVLGGVAGGIFGGRAISGGYGGNGAVNTGTAIGAAVGSIIPVLGTALGALIGGLVGGLYNRTFGHKAPEIESQGVMGTYDNAGVTGKTYQNILEKGGWFASDRRSSQSQDLTEQMQSQIVQAFTAIKDSANGFAETLGIGAHALDDYSKTFDIKLTGDVAKDQDALTKFFEGVSDEVANKLVPNLASFSQTGETATATLQRLVGEFDATTTAAQNLGKTAADMFGYVGMDSAAARERLVQLAGGVSALTSLTGSFAQNFLTDAERLAPLSKALDTALGSLGLSTIPATNEQFKALVQSINPADEASSKLLVSLLQLSDAFYQVHKSADDTAAAVLGDKLDAAYSTLERAVNAQKNTVTAAYDDAIAKLGDAIDRTKTSVSKLTDLSRALHDAVSQAAGVDMSRSSGQAQIKAALAIAKAGGPLPTADSLKDALSAVTADSKGQFSTFEEYQRDRLQTAIDISNLASVTDNQLDTADRQLAVLEATKTAADAAYNAEIARLDAVLDTAQRQIDAVKGVDVSVQSVEQAVAALAVLMAGNTNAGIVGAYGNALGRAPDAAGLAYWQQQAAAGVSIGGITSAISNSAEAADKIEKLYETVFNRTADAGGMSYWQQQLAGGSSLGQIEAAMRASDEARARLTAPATSGSTPTTIAPVSTADVNKIIADALAVPLNKIASYTQRTAVASEDQARVALEGTA